MKHLRAQDSYLMDHNRKYEIVTLSMDDIVPASIYDEVPDADHLKEEIKDGEMDRPLMLWPMTQRYWKDVHLRYYRRGNPDLPEVAPEKDGEVLVVWKGRQRYQLAREMGFTHVDCVIEREQHKIVAIAQQENNN
jgi:hypothetical protein